MATIFIYNNYTNRIERYVRSLNQPMPYNVGGSLTVGEFRGKSRSNILWTDRKTMEAWNRLRRYWGRPISVGYAFSRIWEGGHTAQSQHYAGVAFDVGQNLTYNQRVALRNFAFNSGLWTYVEPISLTPRWVHFDKRFGIPACARGGFPELRIGSRGNYVFILQDALSAIGYTGAGLDGVYGAGTSAIVKRFQRAHGIYPSGVTNCVTWSRLTSLANGRGRTSTVIN